MNPRRCLTAKETWLLQIVKLYLQNNGRLSSFSFSLLAIFTTNGVARSRFRGDWFYPLKGLAISL